MVDVTISAANTNKNNNNNYNNTQRSLTLTDNSTDTTMVAENECNYSKTINNNANVDNNDELAANCRTNHISTNHVSCGMNENNWINNINNNNSSVCEV